uniref:Nucleotide-binding oligomerization domain-containing protein 1 n=1 Tax=Knipowitschia caucasica TaxID=637954 RepID=A0AAV2MAW8_KNICA
MGKAGEDKPSCRSLLTFHREALVSKLRSIQCVLDNLLSAELLCEEEVEAVQRTDTKPNQVRKLLELVQCKGEPACEYFIYILYSVGDAFIHLQPWLKEICYVPSAEVSALPVDNTDPISRYSDKQRREISRDTSFIMSYGQREETRLEHLYTDTLMELFNEANESLGFLDTLDRLLTDDAVFNPQGETIYVVGDAGVGKSILLQKLQNLWSKKQLVTDTIFLFKFRCRMFSTFKDSEQISLRDLLFKYNCCPDLDPDNEVFDYITNFPHKVLFTFDGYDEIQDDLERCIYETGNKGIAKMTAKGITAGFIKLGYCNVYSGDCTALNFVLQHRRKLLGLDMDNNNVSDYGIKQLRPSLSKMTIVRFCVNNLSDSSMEVLAEELCKSKVVEVLGLYNNFITDAGAKLVAKIIEECPKLRTVKIGKNKITPVGGRYLANAIQKSTSIFDVGMWGNTLGDEGAFAFAEALRHHPSLSNLSLSANGITSEGGKHLSSALKDNNSLRIFWLVQNDLSDDCASHFAELVRTNTGLTHLWLINNKFTVEGIRRLAEALPENNHLKEICLKGNLLSPAEEEEFVEEKRLRFH